MNRKGNREWEKSAASDKHAHAHNPNVLSFLFFFLIRFCNDCASGQQSHWLDRILVAWLCPKLPDFSTRTYLTHKVSSKICCGWHTFFYIFGKNKSLHFMLIVEIPKKYQNHKAQWSLSTQKRNNDTTNATFDNTDARTKNSNRRTAMKRAVTMRWSDRDLKPILPAWNLAITFFAAPS